MTIITCVTAGVAATIRLFGPESIGGMGDFGARIDAEVARTGLPPDEIGNEVCSPHDASYILLKRSTHVLFKDI